MSQTITLQDATIADLRAALGSTPPPAPPPPVPTPGAGQWIEYDEAFIGKLLMSSVALDVAGKPVLPLVQGPQWSSTPGVISPLAKALDVCGAVDWGTAREFHRVTPFKGAQWGWIDGYGSPTNAALFYPVETIRADWIDLAGTGLITDITPPQSVPPSPQGQPYIPNLVPSAGSFKIRVWGWIWNGMNLSRSAQFYWEATLNFGTSVTNLAWSGSAQTRQAIVQYEGWWSAGVWTRAHGSAPFDVAGAPLVPTITYDGFNAWGRGVGVLWAYQYPSFRVGVSSAVPF